MPEIGRLTSLVNENNAIEDDEEEHEEEEEEEIRDENNDRIDLSENYQFARVIMLMKLKKDILEERKNKMNRNIVGYTFLSLFGMGAVQSVETQQLNAVDDYWSGNVSTSPTTTHINQPNMIFDVKILQMVFRVWIELKKMRAVRKIANKNSEKTVMIQSAVRRWLTKKHFLVLENEKLARDRAFRNFCVEMKKGVEIDMFSKKKGMTMKRVVRIADGCLVYKINAWHSSKYPCNTIYAVNKGLSPHKYSTDFQGQKALCFHLLLIGDIVLDFCAKDTLQCKMLVDGFNYLRMLLFTQAPFYIDEQGFPRRANESIISRALEIAEGRVEEEEEEPPVTRSFSKSIAAAFLGNKDAPAAEEQGERGSQSETDPLKMTFAPVKRVKGAISEADDMRLVTAKSLLQSEYKLWNEAYHKEKEEWMEEVRSRHHRHGRRRKKHKSGAGASSEGGSGSVVTTSTVKIAAKPERPRSMTAAFANMFKRKSKKGPEVVAPPVQEHHDHNHHHHHHNHSDVSVTSGSASQSDSTYFTGSGTSYTGTGSDATSFTASTMTPVRPGQAGGAVHPPPPAPPVASIPTPGVKPALRPQAAAAPAAAPPAPPARTGAGAAVVPPAAPPSASDVAAMHSALSRSTSGKEQQQEEEEEEESSEEEEDEEEESSGEGEEEEEEEEDSEESEGGSDEDDEESEEEEESDEEEESEDDDETRTGTGTDV